MFVTDYQVKARAVDEVAAALELLERGKEALINDDYPEASRLFRLVAGDLAVNERRVRVLMQRGK